MALEYYVEDCKELLYQIKEQEKVLRFKRRWLMDLPVSEYLMSRLNPVKDKTIPEIFLREDDANYDIVKSSVERVLGVTDSVKEQQVEDDVQTFYSKYILKNLSFLLNKMTLQGLQSFAELVTDRLVEYEKSRKKMKRVIREHLPVFLSEENCNFQLRRKQISCLLKDCKNFNGSHDLLGSSTKYQITAIRLLNELGNLPLQTLKAMRRKLNGENGHIPEMGSYKRELKPCIIGHVKNRCMTLLSDLNEGGELPEPLIKALVVAGLTLKLIVGRSSVPEFQKFSPQIESLQNDIARAISLLSSGVKVRSSEIDELYKRLPHMDGSEVMLSQKSMRAAVSNMLMDFLFECSDMAIIPDSLQEAVFYINTKFCDSGHRSTLKDDVEEEVELLLGFSAQIKQIVWDLVPGLEVDNDFANSFMEDFEENSDDEEGVLLPRDHASYDDLKSLSESCGETIPFNSGILMSAGTEDDFCPSSLLESEMLEKKHSFNGNEHQLASFRMHKQSASHSFLSKINQVGSSVPLSIGGTKVWHDMKTKETMYDSPKNAEVLHSFSPTKETGSLRHELHSKANKYLAIQKACDNTSMAMYHIIGGMLAEFAQSHQLNLSRDDLSYLHSHASVPDNLKAETNEEKLGLYLKEKNEGKLGLYPEEKLPEVKPKRLNQMKRSSGDILKINCIK